MHKRKEQTVEDLRKSQIFRTAESMSGGIFRVSGIHSGSVDDAVILEKVEKGARWMPWLTEAMKDVISCDKPRVGANNP